MGPGEVRSQDCAAKWPECKTITLHGTVAATYGSTATEGTAHGNDLVPKRRGFDLWCSGA